MISTGRRPLIPIVLHVVSAAAWAWYSLGFATDLSRFEAGIMAIGISLAFTRTIGRWDDRLAGPRSPGDRPRGRWLNLALLVVGSAFLAVTVLAGEVHDYVAYLRHWAYVLSGEDPWHVESTFWGVQPPNAYGPMFNLLGVLVPLNPLSPKLLFATAYIASAIAMTKALVARRSRSPLAILGLMLWAWNPFSWVEVAIRGHFDVLVALASVAAVHARRSGRDLPCGLALAVGVLLKFIPITLLPSLALDGGRIRLRLVAIASALTAIGFGLSCLAWGRSTFAPLGFAASRASTYLSIFRFLGGRFSPLRPLGLAPYADRLALPALSLSLVASWWWCRSRRVDPATAAFLASLVTLLLYRNGFPQYQMVPLMLGSYWAAQTWNRRIHRTALAIALVGYFAWISAFVVAYALIGDGSDWFEDSVGLPTFVLGCGLIACLVWSEPAPDAG